MWNNHSYASSKRFSHLKSGWFSCSKEGYHPSSAHRGHTQISTNMWEDPRIEIHRKREKASSEKKFSLLVSPTGHWFSPILWWVWVTAKQQTGRKDVTTRAEAQLVSQLDQLEEHTAMKLPAWPPSGMLSGLIIIFELHNNCLVAEIQNSISHLP